MRLCSCSFFSIFLLNVSKVNIKDDKLCRAIKQILKLGCRLAEKCRFFAHLVEGGNMLTLKIRKAIANCCSSILNGHKWTCPQTSCCHATNTSTDHNENKTEEEEEEEDLWKDNYLL